MRSAATVNHNFVNGECEVCGETQDLTFMSQDLSFQYYIGLQSSVSTANVDRYDEDYGMANSEKLEGIDDYASYGMIIYDKQVVSTNMTEEVTFTLYGVKDGVTYTGQTLTNSVERKALEVIKKYHEAGSNADICTILVNMLKCGAAAQTTFGTSFPMADADIAPYAQYATTGEVTLATSFCLPPVLH